MNPAERILSVLAKHLQGPAEIRLLGGAALTLGYGMPRSTEDVDLLLDDDELECLVRLADFGEALDAANRELQPEGLYLTHIWGPEHQILGPQWREHCHGGQPGFRQGALSVTVLGPMDLVLSKLCRADEGDIADIRFLIATQGLTRAQMEAAVAAANVPDVFTDVFAESSRRLLALPELG